MKKKLLCFLAIFIVLFSSLAFAQKDSLDVSKKAAVELKQAKFPVNPFKDTLFFVYNKVGSFSAENRAKAITEKIRKLYEDSLFDSDSLVIIPSDISQDIVYKDDFIIMSILDVDAKAENQTQEFIAKRNLSFRLGLAHDPRRSVATTDVDFYTWTQWIFLQVFNAWYDETADKARHIDELVAEFEAGRRPTPSGEPWSELEATERRRIIDSHRLAYLSDAPVNWCPGLGTVLANEEVTNEGRSPSRVFRSATPAPP